MAAGARARLKQNTQIQEISREGKKGGWGARIRTWECRYQKPVPYRLATPQQLRLRKVVNLCKGRDHNRRRPNCQQKNALIFVCF
jgi:hypothetical protein